MSGNPFKSFSTERGLDNPIEREAAIILEKPKDGRIDEETLTIIRNRLVTRLEDQWTEPGGISWPDEEIVTKLRTRQPISQNRKTQLVLARLLQDYGLDPDERDKVKENIFGEVK